MVGIETGSYSKNTKSTRWRIQPRLIWSSLGWRSLILNISMIIFVFKLIIILLLL